MSDVEKTVPWNTSSNAVTLLNRQSRTKSMVCWHHFLLVAKSKVKSLHIVELVHVRIYVGLSICAPVKGSVDKKKNKNIKTKKWHVMDGDRTGNVEYRA